MKKILSLALCCMAFLALLIGGAWAAEFCVDNATDLQTALTTAQSNGANNTIKVVQGTYSGHFTHSSSGNYSITLWGGYTAGCASREVNPANTILDGAHTGRVLYLNYSINGATGNIQVDGFTIQNGSVNGSGGGVYASTSTSLASATAGAITLSNNTIAGNTATNYHDCGGVCALADSDSGIGGNVTLLNNTITGNTASNNGGGAYIESWTLIGTSTAGTITLANNTITENSASFVGGIAVEARSAVGTAGAGTIIFTSNTITGNTSASEVGGVYVSTVSASGTAGTITFTNNTIAGNSASATYGGGIEADSQSASGTGGTVTFTNNTITGNTAGTNGGGLYLYKRGNTINCYNNIIRGNIASTGGDIFIVGTTGTVNGYNNDYTNMPGGWTNSGNNVNYDPLFVGGGNYRLQASSPCIDTGVNSAPSIPSTDADGNARILDGDNNGTKIADMGAYEFVAYTVLHKDGAVWNGAAGSGWTLTAPPYYPGTNYAMALGFTTSGYMVLHRDGAIWNSDTGWTLTAPPYYPGTAYARALEIVGTNYVILHKDGAIYNSATGWITTSPPYYSGTGYAVDLKVR
jgi:hypothetical protein